MPTTHPERTGCTVTVPVFVSAEKGQRMADHRRHIENWTTAAAAREVARHAPQASGPDHSVSFGVNQVRR